MVGGKPLDLKKHYTIASNDYVLLKGGDAISFAHAQLLGTEKLSDLQALENYLLNNLHGIISQPYDRPQGRIDTLSVEYDSIFQPTYPLPDPPSYPQPKTKPTIQVDPRIRRNTLRQDFSPADEYKSVRVNDIPSSGDKPTVAPRQ